MQFNGGEAGIFIDHPADGLVRQDAAILVCKEVSTVFDFVLKIILVFFQDIYDIIVSDL